MHRSRLKIFIVMLFMGVSLFFLIEKNFLPGLTSKLSPAGSPDMLGQVVSLIKDDYVETPDPDRTMTGAFQGLVGSLDPLSGYLDEATLAKYEGRSQEELQDIGIVLYKRPGAFPVVIGIREDSPAEQKGIKIGDFISNLDGRSTLMMSMTEANLVLKGRTDSSVTLKKLSSEDSQEITIIRQPLSKEPFDYTESPSSSGILRIQRFDPPLVNSLRDDLVTALRSRNKSLIIDLRNCHEGDFEEARRFINIFLRSDNLGYFQGKEARKDFVAAPDKPLLETLPLVIWTNRATIGPAEAAAALLKKQRNAKIIGLRTPGLVARQNLIRLEDGSGILLTSEIFHIDGETDFWEKGIEPDVNIDGEDLSSEVYFKETQKLLS